MEKKQAALIRRYLDRMDRKLVWEYIGEEDYAREKKRISEKYGRQMFFREEEAVMSLDQYDVVRLAVPFYNCAGTFYYYLCFQICGKKEIKYFVFPNLAKKRRVKNG